MITSRFLTAIEKALNKLREVEIMPLFEGDPTSGKIFTSLTAENLRPIIQDQSYQFIITFSVTTFLKERDVPIQEKDKPYKELLNLQERIMFFLMLYSQPFESLRTEFGQDVSVSGIFTPDSLNTRPDTVGPMFYASYDKPTPREQAIYLSQRFTGPKLTVRSNCAGALTPWADVGFVKQ